jgi:hypothetical protein
MYFVLARAAHSVSVLQYLLNFLLIQSMIVWWRTRGCGFSDRNKQKGQKRQSVASTRKGKLVLSPGQVLLKDLHHELGARKESGIV